MTAARAALLVAVAFVALLAASLYGWRERPQIDGDVRAAAAGSYVRLRDGITHYDLLGDPGGDLVVFVHGFSSPMYVWGRLPRHLVDEGFQVLRYDLFGRGFSDRPPVDYGLDLYERQLRGLLRAVGAPERVHLIGLSMGGAISVDFAARHPAEVGSLTLLAPAGYPQPEPLAMRALRVPLLGELLLGAAGDRVLVGSNARSVYDQSLVADLERRFRIQLGYDGYLHAVLSTLRRVPFGKMQTTYRKAGSSKRPVLLIWGREDEVLTIDAAKPMRAALRQPEFHAIPRAGHLVHLDRPDRVLPVVSDFLKRAWIGEGGAPPIDIVENGKRRRRDKWPRRRAPGITHHDH